MKTLIFITGDELFRAFSAEMPLHGVIIYNSSYIPILKRYRIEVDQTSEQISAIIKYFDWAKYKSDILIIPS